MSWQLWLLRAAAAAGHPAGFCWKLLLLLRANSLRCRLRRLVLPLLLPLCPGHSLCLCFGYSLLLLVVVVVLAPLLLLLLLRLLRRRLVWRFRCRLHLLLTLLLLPLLARWLVGPALPRAVLQHHWHHHIICAGCTAML